jgi:hypothetical protein
MYASPYSNSSKVRFVELTDMSDADE